MIRVAVAGAAGKMGREVVKAVVRAPDLTLVAAVGRHHGVGEDAGLLAGIGPIGVKVGSDLRQALSESQAQVCVDFTLPEAGAENGRTVLEAGVCLVMGTTGLPAAELAALERLARERRVGGVVAPNFALGAILMMHFAAQAARVFPEVEIIEAHNPQKRDAPSGTARRTAELIARSRAECSRWAAAASGVNTSEPAPAGNSPARGLLVEGVPVHSLRLPGVVAHQEVVFGMEGQTLRLIHDSADRSSFMPGVLLAIRRAPELKGLVTMEELLADVLRSPAAE